MKESNPEKSAEMSTAIIASIQLLIINFGVPILIRDMSPENVSSINNGNAEKREKKTNVSRHLLS